MLRGIDREMIGAFADMDSRMSELEQRLDERRLDELEQRISDLEQRVTVLEGGADWAEDDSDDGYPPANWRDEFREHKMPATFSNWRENDD